MELEFAICLEKAQKRDSEAQRELGCLYRMGLGVNKDEAQAAKWYQKAAEAGNTKAQFYLGRLYEEGLGIAKDEARAMQWYLKAAQGNQSLVEGLRANTTLTSINLKRNQIGAEGTQALAETLKTNTTLTSINLDDNQIGESEALQHINTFCKRNEALTQAVKLYALFLACFPTVTQDAYLHLKEVTTSSTQRPIVRFFQMAGKLPDDVLHGLAYQVYDQARDFIPLKAKASAANKLLKQLREEDSVNSKMKAKSY